MHVAKRQGRDVAAVLARTQRLNSGQAILNGGVQLVVDGVLHTIFLPANSTNLNLKDHLGGVGAGQQFTANAQVLLKGLGGTVPHVGVEDGVPARGHFTLGCLQQGQHKAIQLVLGAVVRVQGHVDRVVLGNFAREGGEAQGTGNHVLDAGT